MERFSLTLIARLEELFRLGGVAAHGEMLSSTVCLAEPWCQTTDLRLAGTVDMDAKYYGSSESVFASTTRWEREDLYERHRAKGAPGVWVHAVKNFCNALALASNGTARVSADDPAVPFVLAELRIAVSSDDGPANAKPRHYPAGPPPVPASCNVPELPNTPEYARAERKFLEACMEGAEINPGPLSWEQEAEDVIKDLTAAPYKGSPWCRQYIGGHGVALRAGSPTPPMAPTATRSFHPTEPSPTPPS